MPLSLVRLAIPAVLAAGLPVLPAAAQSPHPARPPAHSPAHPHAGTHRGALHGTASAHPTPKRQHMMEQQRAHHARQHRDGQAQETDRLNEQSLQRAQQGGGAAAAGPGASPASAR